MVTEVAVKRQLSPPSSTGPEVKKQATEETTQTKEIKETIQTEEQQQKPYRRPKQNKQPKIRKKRYKNKIIEETSPSGVLEFEIAHILSTRSLTQDDIVNDISGVLNDQSLANKYHRNVENVEIISLTSNGEGLGIVPNPVEEKKKQIVIVPFAIPGDITNVRVFKTHPNYVESDLLAITTPSIERNNELIRCKYFGKCSGCQYQELPYSTQLEYKKRTVVNAYKYLAPQLIKEGKIPEIGDTVESPKQYGYRTKLTPHFDIPRKKPLNEKPAFGFGAKGKPTWRKTEGGDKGVVDIEECVIGTKIVSIGFENERKRFDQEWSKYKKAATILLREHTKVAKKGEDILEIKNSQEGSRDTEGNVSCIFDHAVDEDEVLIKSCVIEPRQIVTEYINGFTFEFSAGEFFQNNNSILPKVTDYVRSNLQIPNKSKDDPLYLVDAYCGSGLFSITASNGVHRVVGVDVSKESIRFAKKNAERNGVKNAKFIDGQAEKIFGEIDTPNDLTSVIIDPSRKGCDSVFLNQLSDYKPARIVYVSCNVHSQARDVQFFLNHTKNGNQYKIESIRGFDFFPQTHHVESVAVINRI